MLEVTFLVDAARKSAETIRVVFGPVSGKSVSSVSA